MTALPHMLDTIIRPRLMIVSARYALDDYDRSVMLPRLLGLTDGRALPEPMAALRALIALEQTLELGRTRHDAAWRAAQHISVMTALLHEARLCQMQGAIRVEGDAPSLLGSKC